VLRHLGWSFPSKKGMMIPLNSYVWDRTTRISWNVQGLSTSNPPSAHVFRVVFSLPSDSLSDWRRGSGVQWGIVT
jgi:hypothetical protein